MNTTTNHVPTRWERFKSSDFLYYFLRDKVAMFSFAVFVVFVLEIGRASCRERVFRAV